MSRYEIPVVFDVESDPPVPLGIYVRHDEDAVVYSVSSSAVAVAPDDCVAVVTCVVKVP